MNFSKMIQKRPKDTKGTLKRLCKTLAPFKVIIFIVAFLSLLSCLLSLWGHISVERPSTKWRRDRVQLILTLYGNGLY